MAGPGHKPSFTAHSTLAYVSPMQFEENWLANQLRQASA